MDWKEIIKEGMKLIKKGCAEQGAWSKCRQCPFDEYCTAIVGKELEEPDYWELEE